MPDVNSSICANNQQANARSQSYWAGAISASWQKSVAGIFETGNLLLQARDELDRDVFNAMKLPFKIRARQMLMRIAAHPVLANHGSQLPPCWRTIYELTKLPDDVQLARIEDGTINAGMERREVAALLGRPKKKMAAPKPDLLTAWAAESPEGRRVFFDQIPRQEFLALISSDMRAELTELLERQLTAKAANSKPVKNLKHLLHGSMSAALLAALSLLHSIDEPNSTAIQRLANTNQMLNALRALNNTIRAGKEPAIVIVETGTIEALRNPHKNKKKRHRAA